MHMSNVLWLHLSVWQWLNYHFADLTLYAIHTFPKSWRLNDPSSPRYMAIFSSWLNVIVSSPSGVYKQQRIKD